MTTITDSSRSFGAAIETGTTGATRLLRRALHTEKRTAPALLRITLGVIMFPHGAQHLLGWFGGFGFHGTHQWMTETLGFPASLAALAIGVELVAPIALVVGLGGRLAALGIAGLMVGAASTHLEHGFFMNWFGSLPAGAEGYEYHVLALAVAMAVAIQGSGAWSLDRAIVRSR
ncbi:MAG TPA: DoxX family protein [Longimicrobiales bacterium]|nr:DoxX family protein [Longimicrobiales bacterium]